MIKMSITTSGYTHCACRDCMEIIVANNPARPELCDGCITAGCGDPAARGWPECQRNDAYEDGVDDAGTGHGAYEYRSGH